MAKRSLSPGHLPPAKRAHLASSPPSPASVEAYSGFDSLLYDELILHIFAFLSYVDLCALQATNRNWARLCLDNQLWKSLYLREFGRLRLRGLRGSAGRKDGRETKGLPGRATADEVQDWKRMFRISANWRSGRCHALTLDELSAGSVETAPTSPRRAGASLEGPLAHAHVTLAGKYTIVSSAEPSPSPSVLVLSAFTPRHVIHVSPIRGQQLVRVTALAVDQSPLTSSNLHVAVCISNGDIYVHELLSPSRKHYYAPTVKTPRTAPILQAAYNHPVLVTLSESFSLSVYDLSHEAMQVVHVLTSFTSFPPSSLLVLTYASPVYPAHWSVGVTEVILSSAVLHQSMLRLLSTRSTRAFDIPAGWIDEGKLRTVREQWGRKVGSVSGTQTDGRWVVLAPTVPTESPPPGGFTPASLPLQLYRFSSPPPRAGSGATPKLTFVRNLLGQTGPVCALALADGRCVSLGIDGRVWVWDLENAWGTEVAVSGAGDGPGAGAPFEAAVSLDLKGSIVFDERRIITAGVGGVVVRDFDV
ncbi:hypothetical protein BC834DRAFT_867204 [Gloeopeniophorella convolvens]|nr:hypothetical protein BC834DRAFT_867204 [Gloeopeniophorella convolvens]